MQKKRLSSIDRNFMSSLRKYEEHPSQKQMNAQKKETHLQEQQLLIQDIQANIQDLENGNYMKCFTSINLMFTDPNYSLRKHITFQLFVPEEKDFVGFTILNKKEIWILLLLYFDIVNQDKNQYARYLWQSIVKKMTEYLNYELREEVINKVKLYRQKSKITNNQNKQNNQHTSQYYFVEERDEQSKEGREINNSYKEICFDKSYMATLSDNSIIERSQVLEQNMMIIQDQIESATNEDVSIQAPTNSSIDLNNDFVELTYHNSNLNDFQIPDISFQQQSQTEDLIKNSIFMDQASNQVEISLIAQMEQLGFQDNLQSEQLNNALFVDLEEDIHESYQNLGLDQISQTSLENIKIQEASIFQPNFIEENRQTEQPKDNKINNLKDKPIYILDFDKISFDSFSNTDQFCKKSHQMGETPHFSMNQQSINQWTKEEQKDQIQQEEEKLNQDIDFKDYEEQLAHVQAQQILKEDLEQLENDSDEVNDQVETKQQQYDEKNSSSKIELNDIINVEYKLSSSIINSKQKTIDDYFKPKNKISSIQSKNCHQLVEEEPIKKDEFDYSSQNERRRKSRISKIMQKSNVNSQLDYAFECDLSSQQPSNQQYIEQSHYLESQQISNNKKRRSSLVVDKRYDQNFMDKHGSGYRFEIQKAPQRLKEKYQVEEILVPKRSSKRIHYPERSDLEISKMIIANNEILNYFTPADRQSQQISEEINNRVHPLTYFHSFNKNDKNQIIVLSNNQEQFINDIVEIEICLANINDNESHHIVKIVSGQLNGQIAIAQIKKQSSEQIIFEDYNFYNKYIHFQCQQSQAIYLPLGSYLINQC
ncbi:unnamed protein product (macronuclear) [Paramecium tetraurelia]|uniref:PIH1 N-terminal domain-containing protein n=1 Tax=Paramecium tetraurelia TaxID=5888 RepID=A0BBC6_PARTE|nr:uncharacterized protein GSPATT00000278001 [Paramecium tetraurelia]CAK55843.1 unnamed protein product [Paramecium tetraurelia]|eukprot:XP_001423241.1 hypothetical protein (macronuclear) [Paramecium tetraurelia strain d4-2]